jgi:hypothetical protein
MKKKCFAGFLLQAGMIFIVSCQSLPDAPSREKRQAENGPDKDFPSEWVMTESVPMDTAAEYEGPRMLINLTIRDLPLQGTLGKLIRDLVFDGLDAETYGENLIAGQRRRYREAGQKNPAGDGFFSESWNWTYDETIEGVLVTPGGVLPGIDLCLAVSKNRDYYLGGAHGMREKRYFMFDMANSKTISLDDVIRKDARAGLQQLIAAGLRDYAGIGKTAPLTQGGFFTDEVEITENFFLAPEGIGFHWDPYEIAPYAMGSIEIVIPNEKSKALP